MRLRRVLAVVAIAAFPAVAVACGGSDALSPGDAVAAAPAKTAEAGSYRADFTIRMSGIGAEPVTMTGEGEFDAEAQVGRMTFDMSDLGAAEGADLGEAEMIFEQLVVYMKFPFLQQVRPGMKPWLKFDLQKLGEQEGIDLGGLEQLNQSDPSQALAYLKAASGDIEEVGTEEIRGVETTHYELTVDLRKVVEQAPGQKENVERVIEQSGIEKVPTQVWIDGDGQVRRMELLYEGMRFGQDQTGDMAMTMELFDFGVEVDVEPPPADQVTDVSELLGQAPQ
jgi:hypothetical protein